MDADISSIVSEALTELAANKEANPEGEDASANEESTEQVEAQAEESEEQEEEPKPEPKKTSDLARKAREEKARRQSQAREKQEIEQLKTNYNKLNSQFESFNKNPVAWLKQNMPHVYNDWTMDQFGGQKEEEPKAVTQKDIDAVREEYQKELERRDAAIEARNDALGYLDEMRSITKDVEDISDLDDYTQEAHGMSFYDYAVAEVTAYAKECVAKNVEYDLPADESVEAIAEHIRKLMTAGEKVKAKKSKKAEPEEVESTPKKKSKPRTLTSGMGSAKAEKNFKNYDDLLDDAIKEFSQSK